jgi:hypothetical protein
MIAMTLRERHEKDGLNSDFLPIIVFALFLTIDLDLPVASELPAIQTVQ